MTDVQIANHVREFADLRGYSAARKIALYMDVMERIRNARSDRNRRRD